VTVPQRVSLSTQDGVRLVARYWESGLRDVGCVVAHGFTGSSGKAPVVAICRALRAAGFGVLAPDLRGHGGSAGRCTAGDLERHDVAAAVCWLRQQGYHQVVVLGWSMGGSAVLRHAGLGGDADAVVSVSSPGLWFERGTRPMRVVHWMCETRTGRLGTRVLRRTRVVSHWPEEIPAAPAEVAGAISAPLLIVHGDADHYFPLHHIEALRLAAPNADVWVEPGMAHAETATTPELMHRIVEWVTAATTARAPVCDDGARD
jgi:pimeloyl-ACP methyl ester carboxylesterase